jgi:RNA polymerase sigma-70 factor (ECF subfamily)
VNRPPRSASGGETLSDALVVQRMVDGDRAAVAVLYDRYGDLVFSLASRIVGSTNEAEDVTQDVFTQAWLQAARYDPDRASAAAWLLNIARTRAIDRHRANRTRERVVADDARVAAAPGLDPDQEQRAIHAERARLVRTALGALGAPQREAIELAYFGGLTHGEIALRLGQPLGTIKTRIRSALLKLREALMERT